MPRGDMPVMPVVGGPQHIRIFQYCRFDLYTTRVQRHGPRKQAGRQAGRQGGRQAGGQRQHKKPLGGNTTEDTPYLSVRVRCSTTYLSLPICFSLASNTYT